MLKKQIIFIFSLYLLFFNISFPMEEIEKDDSKEKQLIIYQSPLERLQQSFPRPTIPSVNPSHADSSDIDVNERLFKSWFKEAMGLAFFDSISGLQEICHRMRILPKTEHVRILLDGPSGSGKSIIAEAFAKMLGKKIRTVWPSDANTEWQDSIGNKIKSIFTGDESRAPYAIIIKKVDQVVANMDCVAVTGFMDKAEDEQRYYPLYIRKVPRVIFVVITENQHSDIQPSIEGRLRQIKVSLPDYSLRATIFRNYFTLRYRTGNIPDYIIDPRGCNCESLIQFLTKETKGFSVKDLKKLFLLAEQLAIDEQPGKDVIVLQETHVRKAYKEIWQKTVAAEKYWPRIAKNWIRNVTKKYGPHILFATIVTGIFYKCSNSNRNQEEEQNMIPKECKSDHPGVTWLNKIHARSRDILHFIKNMRLCKKLKPLFKKINSGKLE